MDLKDIIIKSLRQQLAIMADQNQGLKEEIESLKAERANAVVSLEALDEQCKTLKVGNEQLNDLLSKYLKLKDRPVDAIGKPDTKLKVFNG